MKQINYKLKLDFNQQDLTAWTGSDYRPLRRKIRFHIEPSSEVISLRNAVGPAKIIVRAEDTAKKQRLLASVIGRFFEEPSSRKRPFLRTVKRIFKIAREDS